MTTQFCVAGKHYANTVHISALFRIPEIQIIPAVANFADELDLHLLAHSNQRSGYPSASSACIAKQILLAYVAGGSASQTLGR